MIWMLGGYMWLFVHRPFEVWPALGALQIERIYMILMLLVWLGTPNKGWVPNRLHYVLAAFTVLLTVSWLLSPYMSQAICMDTIESYFKVVVFYFLVLTTVRDERGLRLLIMMFLAAVGLYMAHSTLEFVRGRYQWRMGIRRMLGVDVTYSDPNAFASSLLYSLPLTMPLWAMRPPKSLRILLVGYTLGVCACIALTGSRSGFVALIALTMMVLLVTVQRKWLVLMLAALAGGIGFALAVTVLPEELQNRYLTLVDSSYGPKNAAVSAKGRVDGFMHGLEAWEKSPLIGHGPRGFDFATGRLGGAHNLYGQVLSEMGTAGALLLLALVLCFFLNWLEVWRFHRDHPDEPRDFPFYVSRAIGLIVVLLLLLGWSGHTLYRYNWQWFAAFQAIAVHCVRQKAARYAGPNWQAGGVSPLLLAQTGG
ncbi:MAG TPA: O-antigen ligase family protein [Gemmataceae bacterium]